MDRMRSDSSSSASRRGLSSDQQSFPLPELRISGGRLLLALAVTACPVGALVWMLVRYWLFAP
jgi:hypothetical protein